MDPLTLQDIAVEVTTDSLFAAGFHADPALIEDVCWIFSWAWAAMM